MDEDTIRELLEDATRGVSAPADLRGRIDSEIAGRDVVFGLLELFTMVPVYVLREALGLGGASSATPEDPK